MAAAKMSTTIGMDITIVAFLACAGRGAGAPLNHGEAAIAMNAMGAMIGMWSTPAYFNGTVYNGGAGDYLKAFSISNAAINPTPVAQSTTALGYPGASPSISANGTNNAIVWALETSGFPSGPAILRAYNATNIAQELYNSSLNLARDNPGNAVKYTVPTVANGKVYAGTQTELDVYGLLEP